VGVTRSCNKGGKSLFKSKRGSLVWEKIQFILKRSTAKKVQKGGGRSGGKEIRKNLRIERTRISTEGTKGNQLTMRVVGRNGILRMEEDVW